MVVLSDKMRLTKLHNKMTKIESHQNFQEDFGYTRKYIKYLNLEVVILCSYNYTYPDRHHNIILAEAHHTLVVGAYSCGGGAAGAASTRHATAGCLISSWIYF